MAQDGGGSAPASGSLRMLVPSPRWLLSSAVCCCGPTTVAFIPQDRCFCLVLEVDTLRVRYVLRGHCRRVTAVASAYRWRHLRQPQEPAAIHPLLSLSIDGRGLLYLLPGQARPRATSAAPLSGEFLEPALELSHAHVIIATLRRLGEPLPKPLVIRGGKLAASKKPSQMELFPVCAGCLAPTRDTSEDGWLCVLGDMRGWISIWHVPASAAETHVVGSLSPITVQPVKSPITVMAAQIHPAAAAASSGVQEGGGGERGTGLLVAVGYQSGVIAVLDVLKGVVVERLQGNSSEVYSLAWDPEQPSTLAATNQDGIIRLWTLDSSGAFPASPEQLSLPGSEHASSASGGRGGPFKTGPVPLAWLSDHRFVTGSLVDCRLMLWLPQPGLCPDSVKRPRLYKGLRGVHTRTINTVSATGPDTFISTGMDRLIAGWREKELLWSLPTVGGYVYHLEFSRCNQSRLGLACGDNALRLWNWAAAVGPSLRSLYDVTTLWRGIQDQVYQLSWHPTQDGLLAFGTQSGYVGLMDLLGARSAYRVVHRHRRPVYDLQWVPRDAFDAPLLGRLEGAAQLSPHLLLSCAGEGDLQLGDAEKGDSVNIMDPAGNRRCSAFRWVELGDSASLLAAGDASGGLTVWRLPAWQVVLDGKPHRKLVNRIRWMPRPPCLHLASCGDDGLLNVWQVTPRDSSLEFLPVLSLPAHERGVTSLDWHPSRPQLATCSFDGRACVWDLPSRAMIGEFGVGAPGCGMLSIVWDPLDPDQVIVAGTEQCVVVYNLRTDNNLDSPQPMAAAPKRSRTTYIPRPIPAFPAPSSLEPPPPREEEEDASAAPPESIVAAAPPPSSSSISQASSSTVPAVPPPPSPATLGSPAPAAATGEKRDRKVKKFLPRFAPVNVAVSTLRADVEELASQLSGQPATGAVEVDDRRGRLLLFGGVKEALESLSLQEEALRAAGDRTKQRQVGVWRGDLVGTIREAVSSGQMTAPLLGMAAGAGERVWREAALAYAHQLAAGGEHMEAATLLLSLGNVEGALEAMHDGSYYREACHVAQAHLLPQDPLSVRCWQLYSEQLVHLGSYEEAAKCLLKIGDVQGAVSVLERRAGLPSLMTALTVVRLLGSRLASPQEGARLQARLAQAAYQCKLEPMLLSPLCAVLQEAQLPGHALVVAIEWVLLAPLCRLFDGAPPVANLPKSVPPPPHRESPEAAPAAASLETVVPALHQFLTASLVAILGSDSSLQRALQALDPSSSDFPSVMASLNLRLSPLGPLPVQLAHFLRAPPSDRQASIACLVKALAAVEGEERVVALLSSLLPLSLADLLSAVALGADDEIHGDLLALQGWLMYGRLVETSLGLGGDTSGEEMEALLGLCLSELLSLTRGIRAARGGRQTATGAQLLLERMGDPVLAANLPYPSPSLVLLHLRRICQAPRTAANSEGILGSLRSWEAAVAAATSPQISD